MIVEYYLPHFYVVLDECVCIIKINENVIPMYLLK